MWLQYYEVEPFGEERNDLRIGQVAAAVYNVNRAKKTDKVWSPADFILKFDGERHTKKVRRPMDAEGWKQLKADMKALPAARARQGV